MPAASPSDRLRPDFPGLLAAHGVRVTPQRLAVARVLLDRPQHLSADVIAARLRARGLSASKATIYNTLRVFAAQGLVREVVVDPERVFYDSRVDAHHHFWNEDTHELTDIPALGVALSDLPPLPPGTETAGVDVIVRLRRRA
jgi:Fur family iron response transcriptional regulator